MDLMFQPETLPAAHLSNGTKCLITIIPSDIKMRRPFTRKLCYEGEIFHCFWKATAMM